MSTSTEEPQFLEHACDATRMLNKRRQLFDIKERFAAEKEAHEERCKVLEQKEAELTKRDLEFQAKMVRFKIYTTQNETKQKKLARRLADEVKTCENIDKEAAVLTTLLNEKKLQRKDLEESAEKQKKYCHLLGSNNMSDVLDRYESLKQSRERLHAKLELLEGEIETLKEEADQLEADSTAKTKTSMAADNE